MEGKILKDPSPLPSPAKWRGLMKRKEFKDTPHFGSLLDEEEEENSEKILVGKGEKLIFQGH
jgi:hypothetical protein